MSGFNYFDDDSAPDFDLDLVDYRIKDDKGGDTTFIQYTLCPFLEDKITYEKSHDLKHYDYKTLNGSDVAKYLTIAKYESKYKALDAVTRDNNEARQRRKDEKRKKKEEAKKQGNNNKKTTKHYK